MTVQLPPPDRLYSVRAVVPGDATSAAVDELSKRLGTKATETLRRGVSGMTFDFAPEGGSVALTARVNDWHGGAAAIRIVTLLLLKAGPEWDVHRASLAVEPVPVATVRSRPDSIEQGRTTTNAA